MILNKKIIFILATLVIFGAGCFWYNSQLEADNVTPIIISEKPESLGRMQTKQTCDDMKLIERIGTWNLKKAIVNDVELSTDMLASYDLGEDGVSAINTSFVIDEYSCLTLYKDDELCGYDTLVAVEENSNSYTLKHNDSYVFTMNDDGTISLNAGPILIFEKSSSNTEIDNSTSSHTSDDSAK